MPANPPDVPSRAVFLSYASQDAEAARGLCDAMRAAGVEVWFDQSELRGGDAWDQKIRRQIRECALFVPVISRHTQERLEGYYRLEWKLAVDRSHLMSEEKVFFVPVVIDDIPDAEAMVPARFRDVQWTRLPRGQNAAAFAGHVKQLLDATRASGSKAAMRGAADAQAADRGRPTTSVNSTASLRRNRWGLVLIGVAVIAALSITKPWQRANPIGKSADLPPGAAGEQREARQFAESARRHYQGIFTRADLAQAEEFGKRAAQLDPTLALAWSVQAGANACYLMRGFVAGDAAQQRARDAQGFAQRALTIDRNETEALIALGQVAMFQNAPAQAEAFYRRVLAKEPENPFATRFLSIVLRTTGRWAEAITLMQQAVKHHPRDTLTHFDLAVAYAAGWNWPRAWDEADAALAVEPFPGALMLKVRLAFQWKGDVALMRQLLEQLDVTYRGEDDAVVWEMRCGLFERKPERVFEAAGRTARTYLEESYIFPAPKAWFTAHAYRLAGKSGLARQHWEIAAALLRERLNADPQNLDLRLKLAVTLAWMKDLDKARSELAGLEAAWRDQLNPDRAWDLASFYAAAGDAATAVPLLRQALYAGSGVAPLTVMQLKLDPWWDDIRASPEFAALLQNPPPLPPPAKD
jgi:tetratricopeptide (TPR) repeat protein